MTATVPIPENLVDLPPGPELAAALSGIDFALLSGWDCVEVLKAQSRQVNHERARLMAIMVETGLCDIGPDDRVRRVSVPGEFAADEIRAALVLTRRAADWQFWLAYDLCTRLPAVHAAMETGALDEPRARIFADWTTDLTPAQARAICAALLPRVGKLTTGQLIEQLKKRAIAIDPDWARRRYEHSLTERKVVGSRNPDGSANLAGYNLPLERVAAASARIDTLAAALKNAGDARPIGHIRADLLLGMTDGSYAGLDDPTLLALLHPHNERADDTEAGAEADAAGADPAAASAGADPEPETESKAAAGAEDSAGAEPGAGIAKIGGAGAELEPGASTEDRAGADPEDEAGADDENEPAAAEGAAPCGRAARTGGMELRVQLSTLLGHDVHPAELAGWGPVHAELARDLATSLTGARWVFAITGTDGRLLHAGITRRRPTGSPRDKRNRHVMELQIPETLLTELAARDDPGPWAPVIADLAHQHTHRIPDPYAGDTDRRLPGAALRRYLQIRDRTCIGPGCRATARSADQDHTIDHDHGGVTTEDNLAPACRHDHRLKHEGGWRLEQPQPGQFTWISRLGHRYDVRPPPIIEPLPDPMPADRPPEHPRRTVDDPGPTLEEPPPPPEPEPPPPTPDPADDIPPF